MESTILDVSDQTSDYLERKAGVDLLMRLSAVESVNRNLRSEDAEMVDSYNRENNLLDGNSNGKLEIVEESNAMMVAGNNTTNHNYYPKQEENKQEEPVKVEIPKFQEKKSNPLLQNALSAALGASVLGGGIGIGSFFNNASESKPPAMNAPEIEDTDTIGILEPDKE